mmetsp:Transcript_61031/g.90524  ORF Transcript_61031/g.90524 Transcript_61031/m.90524 type:complete len:83 (-) Transcript_61031:629-877(-)
MKHRKKGLFRKHNTNYHYFAVFIMSSNVICVNLFSAALCTDLNFIVDDDDIDGVECLLFLLANDNENFEGLWLLLGTPLFPS